MTLMNHQYVYVELCLSSNSLVPYMGGGGGDTLSIFVPTFSYIHSQNGWSSFFFVCVSSAANLSWNRNPYWQVWAYLSVELLIHRAEKKKISYLKKWIFFIVICGGACVQGRIQVLTTRNVTLEWKNYFRGMFGHITCKKELAMICDDRSGITTHLHHNGYHWSIIVVHRLYIVDRILHDMQPGDILL